MRMEQSEPKNLPVQQVCANCEELARENFMLHKRNERLMDVLKDIRASLEETDFWDLWKNWPTNEL